MRARLPDPRVTHRLALALALAALVACERHESRPGAIEAAFRGRSSGVQASGEGTVTRILADDHAGSRHQRFVVRLASGHTVLVSHNVDVAPRLERLSVGDAVSFSGEYEWNERGGVIHWTHRDPAGRHAAGWVRHDGRTFD